MNSSASAQPIYDLAVVGGGAGGLTAAREAARRGASVVLVEAGRLGGECTWTGCVPSKALIAAAGRGDDFATAMASVHRAVDHIAATEDESALAAEGIEVRPGRGRLVAPGVLDVDGSRLRARHIVVATGSSPAVPRIAGLDRVPYLTNETVFDLDDQPVSLAVLGGGSVGCELAQAFARLGTRVTLVELAERLLPREEPEASTTVHEALEADGIDVRAGATVVRAEVGRLPEAESEPVAPAGFGATGVRLELTDGGTAEAARLLVAVGRAPNGGALGLEDVGVELDERGFVRTDATLATTARGVWAVGDVTGRLPFTHAAAHMARIAVHNALASSRRPGRGQRFDPTAIPWVTFTDPEIGRVGVTEAEAAAAASGARVAYLPLTEVDRAVAADRTRGFVKLIAAPRRGLGWRGGGRVVGATVAAPSGGELIHEVALAVRTGMFTGRLAQTVHAYPTWSVAIQQAAAQFLREIDGRQARPAADVPQQS